MKKEDEDEIRKRVDIEFDQNVKNALWVLVTIAATIVAIWVALHM